MAKKKTADILDDAIEEASKDYRIAANLSTGATMLDLALSGQVGKAFGPGHYTLYVGDSGSGKTFLLLTMFAEASMIPEYKDYRFLYVSSENGNQFDTERFFGPGVAKRLETVQPESLERMYDMFDKMNAEGTKFIAVVDSTDGMATEAEIKAIKENTKLRESNKDTKGSYGDGKAKVHSARLKYVVHGIEKTGSILAIISQTRDNIDAGMFEEQKTRSGGHALKFYAHSEIWLTVGAAIKKTVNGKDREIGKFANFKVKKNRVNGKARNGRVALLPEFGIDDVGTMMDWLIEEKFLTASGGRYSTPWFEKTYTKEEIIAKMEDEDRVGEIKQFVQESWDSIEAALLVPRKPRYGQAPAD